MITSIILITLSALSFLCRIAFIEGIFLFDLNDIKNRYTNKLIAVINKVNKICSKLNTAPKLKVLITITTIINK